MQKVNILGVKFDSVTKEEAVRQMLAVIDAGEQAYVVTPNPEIVNLCRKNDKAREIVNNATLVLPDGIGIIYASQILGQPLALRVPGIEFAESLVEALAKRQGRLFLLGAKPGIAEKAANMLADKYSGLQIAGTHNGYFEDAQKAVDAINACGGADVVFVCLGAPNQEYFMAEHRNQLQTFVLCGLGGSLDVFSGESKRAPDIFIQLGLEWFYRLLKQPSRIGRIMQLPYFLWLVIYSRVSGKYKHEE